VSVAQVRTVDALAAAPGGFPKYQLIDGAGTVVVAWTGVGVTALTDSAGAPTPTYRVLLDLDPALWYTILWDLGDGAITSETFSGGSGEAALLRDWAAITESVPDRCLLQAGRSLRNRVTIDSAGNGKVFEEDDATEAWPFTVAKASSGAMDVNPG
jgi:hypothetical protein